MAFVAFAAPACFTSIAEAADTTHASTRGVVAIASGEPRATATMLAEIQQRLTAVTAATEPEDAAVAALAESLMTARGTKEGAASIRALASAIAGVLAGGVLAEEELERLAQNLFAASSLPALADRDAGLLAIDVALLLQEAGGDIPAVERVLTALERVCPGAKAPPSGIPVRPTTRSLSVLSRPSSQ